MVLELDLIFGSLVNSLFTGHVATITMIACTCRSNLTIVVAFIVHGTVSNLLSGGDHLHENHLIVLFQDFPLSSCLGFIGLFAIFL